MENIELVLPAGAMYGEFRIEAESMSKLARAVEVLLAECNYNKYTVDVDSLYTTCETINAVGVGVVRTVWGPWACRITLERR